jgi:hypothetical protein
VKIELPKQVDLQEFRDAAKKHAGTKYFQEFYFGDFILHGFPLEAIRAMKGVLNRCNSLDHDAFREIHKGDPYYWLGMASYIIGDYEEAVFFMDAAVSEDLRAKSYPRSHTPALRFALLEATPPDHAARNLVHDARNRMLRNIRYYNNLPGHNHKLTLPNLRKRLLIRALRPGGEQFRSLATALITFCLEWDDRNFLFDIRPGNGTFEPYFLHLLKGCILFESLLRNNPSNKNALKKNTLDQLLPLLSVELGIPRRLDISGKKLSGVLTNLAALDPSNETLETAFTYTGQLRNTLGHDLGWIVNLDKIQYQRSFQFIMAACLHTIESLYKVA